MKHPSFPYVSALLLVLGFGLFTLPNHGDAVSQTVKVTKVIDGDSILVASGERVELLGLDAPEKGECYAQNSQQALSKLVNKKEVKLKARSKNTNVGKLTYAEVYVGKTWVNKKLLREGRVDIDRAHLTSQQTEIFVSSQEQAKKDRKGLWASCDQKTYESQDAAQTLAVEIVSGNFSLDSGDSSKLTVKTKRGAYCSLSVKGTTQHKDQVADKKGAIVWEWAVDAPSGTWPVIVGCTTDQKSGSATRELNVSTPE